MVGQKNFNIVWHEGCVNREEREALLGQRGVVLWFTGLSGSGKSTVANAVAQRLQQLGKLTYLLDGDNIRHGLNKGLGFSLEDRKENIRRISEVAKLFVDAGIITLTAFISPLKQDRATARSLIGKDFIEVHVDCSIEECENRDPKDLYKKARRGEIPEFTGITSPYEVPDNPEVTLCTHQESLEECVEKVLLYLDREILHGLLG